MLGKGIEEGALSGLGLGTTRDLSASGLVGNDDDTGLPQSAQAAQLSSEYVGIVPRCIADMFAWIEKQMAVNTANNSSLDYSITANYLQIYNEVSKKDRNSTPCHSFTLILHDCTLVRATFICLLDSFNSSSHSVVS